MTDQRCTLTPSCEFPPHEASDHPCGIQVKPGDRCRYCDGPQDVVDGVVQPCPKCWAPIDIPTFRALMAAEGFDTAVTRTTES